MRDALRFERTRRFRRFPRAPGQEEELRLASTSFFDCMRYCFFFSPGPRSRGAVTEA